MPPSDTSSIYLKTLTRRSVLSAIVTTLPFCLDASVKATTSPVGMLLTLCFYSFEEVECNVFSDQPNDHAASSRRVEIGHSEKVRVGFQVCHNDRPFAGFLTGWKCSRHSRPP
jgi:hypothetical protein